MTVTPTPPPLSLYLHFPWCVRKCPYCDFNSHPAGATLETGRYIDALLADLSFELSHLETDREVCTVFLGGGTPSLFPAGDMDRLLGEIAGRIAFSPDVEITMEANPGAAEYSDLAGYRAAGINRLSLGAQSFDSRALRDLGRIHSPVETTRAYERARRAGFDNINLDLMFGLPGQDVAGARTDLREALSLGPEHLSLYQLTLEPNTVFHRYPPELPDEDTRYAMQQSAVETAALAGFERYEVSAYARPGYRCGHNLNYWLFGDYIGIGAGAHGKLTMANGGIVRRARRRHPGNYMSTAGNQGAVAEAQQVCGEDRIFEFLMNALRLCDGFPLSLAQSRTGMPAEAISRTIEPAIRKDLLRQAGDHVFCSPKGYLFLDDVLSSLLPAVSAAPDRPSGALEI